MTTATFNVWSGVYASFDQAPAVGLGFDGPIWRERSLRSARETAAKVAAGETLDCALRQRNAILPVVVAMLLSQQSRVSVLDIGGGLGAAFMVLSSVLGDDIARVDHRIVEVESICRAGRELFAAGAGPSFQTELPEGCAVDIVHATSVVHYMEDWRSAIRRLAGYGAPYLVFGDLPIGAFSSYVTLQTYYDSRIPNWFMNAGDFIGEAERQGYDLTLRFKCDGRILDSDGTLPMDNFPPELRIDRTVHLLFAKSGRS